MTKQSQRKTPRRVRSIKTRRDFDGVAVVVSGLAGKSEPDTAAEVRLQQLLKELDKLDLPQDDIDGDLSADDDYPKPGRRWSDESSERD